MASVGFRDLQMLMEQSYVATRDAISEARLDVREYDEQRGFLRGIRHCNDLIRNLQSGGDTPRQLHAIEPKEQ